MAQRTEGGRRGAGGHGLILGKFLPFHNGHRRLIQAALAQCDAVTVAVFSRDAEPIPGHVRAGWIRGECPDARVVHVVANQPDPWDEASWQFWVDACRRCAPAADCLVSGEDYGDELAARMGVRHVRIDRGLDPVVSGTQVRADPIAHWGHVPDAVRPWLAVRVAIVGAESTGKTTLARDLADAYATAWVPEYGREYCELKDIDTLGPGDLLEIALEQARLEDAAAASCAGVLFCDTDLMVTRAWCAHLCGFEHPGIADAERTRRYDLHLVTNPRVAWRDDGTRVCGADSVRDGFHARFVQELTLRGARHMVLPPRQGDALATSCCVLETLWPTLAARRSRTTT